MRFNLTKKMRFNLTKKMIKKEIRSKVLNLTYFYKSKN
jgi:hypothetical protein